MDDTRYFTLTSPAGHFVFPRTTILSHAKLIRDSITAGSRGAIAGVRPPRPENAMNWIKEHIMGRGGISFEWREI